MTTFGFQSVQQAPKTPLVQALHIYLQDQQRTTHLSTSITAKIKNNPKPDRKKNSQESGRFGIFSHFNSKKEAFLLLIFSLFLFKYFQLLFTFFFLKFKAKPKDLSMFAPLPLTHV